MIESIFEKFTPNLKNVLVMAEKVANEQKSRLDTEHQFLALILHKNTLANDILSFFNISVDRAELVSDPYGKKPISKTINGITENAKQAIQLSVQIASKYGSSAVDCEHLLMALVSNNKFNSYTLIERMGIPPIEIKKQIESLFSEIKNVSELNDENDPIDSDIMDMPPISPFGPMPQSHTRTTRSKKSALKTFATNINEEVRKNLVDPVIGRKDEIERIIQILSRRRKNNPILIGEPGVGKTAIVEGLARKIESGEVPAILSKREIYMLDMGSLLAGTMYRGQFESRIKAVLEEIEKKNTVILFVDEVHTVVGTGAAEGSIDAANLLKPKLAKGELRMIGATTFDEYKKYIEKDTAFERRFQPVIVNEPTESEALDILRGIKGNYEKHHHVKYTDEALISAVKFSHRYIQNRFLPDKAIDLLDEAGASTSVISKKSLELSALRLGLRETINEKELAVSKEQYEKATKLRQQESIITNQIKLLEDYDNKNKQVVVDEKDIAKTVSRWCGIPVTNLTISEKKQFLNLEKKLKKFIVGQDEAIKLISEAIRRSRVGIADPKRPIGSFIFLGPTGVGKTELVRVLSREVYGSENSLIKIDMSEFMEKHNISRLIGAPAGYVGYEEGGKLTELIRQKPYSVVLLDEIEKAHPEVFNILLQIMEDGELTDSKGRKVSFKNAIIIMTSNLGTDALTKQAIIGFNSNKLDSKSFEKNYDKLKSDVLSSLEKHFKPEFLNRLDKTIIFKPLTPKAIREIVEIEINKLSKRISDQKISIYVSNRAKNFLIKEGYKPEFGARPMRRVIVELIENPLSEQILSEKYQLGDKIFADLMNNKIILTKKYERSALPKT